MASSKKGSNQHGHLEYSQMASSKKGSNKINQVPQDELQSDSGDSRCWERGPARIRKNIQRAHIVEQKKNEPAPEGDEQLKAIEDALVKEIPWEMGRWVQMVNDGEPLVLNFDQVPLAISGWSRIPSSLARPQSATAKRQTRWRIRISKGNPNHM